MGIFDHSSRSLLMRSRRHPETLNNEVVRTKKAWLTVSVLIHPQSYSVSGLRRGLRRPVKFFHTTPNSLIHVLKDISFLH